MDIPNALFMHALHADMERMMDVVVALLVPQALRELVACPGGRIGRAALYRELDQGQGP